MYKVIVEKCYNPDKFRESALRFEKVGYYTSAPPGTTAYMNFWDEELRRCIYGFTSEEGVYITGYFYFYLNYARITKTQEIQRLAPNGKTKTVARRIESFPRYWDYDKAYFDAVEAAENNGKHLAVIKARGKGYSYKSASMLCRNFYCIPKSKSYAVAAEAEFLTKDGLLTKTWEMMSFIDINTAWGKKRQKKDTVMHRRASYIVSDDTYGIKSEQGWGSEIMGVSLKNDAQKARGKRGKLILWEEAGKFPNLKEAWQIARPSVEDGTIAFGLMIAYGTGGTEDADYEGLKQIFYEPAGYNALPIENVWDDSAHGTACGFFVPQYYNMEGADNYGMVEEGRRFMDEYGNSDVDFTYKYCLQEREKIIAGSSDKTSIDRFIAERPFNPIEATLQVSGNIFPKKDLIRHLAEVRNSEKLKDFKQVGDLYFGTDQKVKWEPDPHAKDITTYRLGPGADTTGSIVIWEHPQVDPPYGLYIIGCDPYDHDQSGTNSLGSAIVYKRFQNFEEYYDLPVAEYTGRPATADDFYEKVRLLSLYYNAKILYENEKKGLFDYMFRKHSEYLLADQPDIIKDIVKDSQVRRGKGIHMTTGIKDWGEGAIKDWLIGEYAPGKMNLTKIFSEALLEELIAYNAQGNFDRVMAFMMIMIYIKELHFVTVKQKKEFEKKSLFKDRLFGDDNYKLVI
jgi:hypothetical protein